MIEVEVLYGDLTRKKESLDDIDKLPKDSVLFILVTTTEEMGKLKNLVVSFSHDHYAICRRRNYGQDWVMLCSWDDDDFVWRRTTNPHEGCNARQQVDIPFGCNHVVFHGVAVKEDEWVKAQKIFNEEMA